MTTDIAKLGFEVDTSKLEEGVVSLNNFKNKATQTNTVVATLASSMSESSKTFAGAVLAMTKSISILVSVTKGATTEQKKAAQEAVSLSSEIYKASQAQNKFAAATSKVSSAIKAQVIDMKTLSRINNLTGVSGLSGKSASDSYQVFRKELGLKGLEKALDEKTKILIKGSAKHTSLMENIENSTGVGRGSAKSASDSYETFRRQMGVEGLKNATQDKGMPRDLMPNRFNTGNIAAQFQDIGVTAAMGMNPLTIAIQQGTQLSAILNTMESPLQGIKEAFKQILNPVTLMSIAFTAIMVILIQFVNWTKVLQKGLHGLASAMNFLASDSGTLIVILGVIGIAIGAIVLTMKFATSQMGIMMGAWIANMVKVAAVATWTGVKMAAAWIIGLGPLAWLTAAIVTLTLALANMFGVDMLKVIKEGINSIIADFIQMFQGMWASAKWVWDKMTGLFKKGGGEIKAGFYDYVTGEMDAGKNKDYVGDVQESIKAGAKKIQDYADGLGKGKNKNKNKNGSSIADFWKDTEIDVQKQLKTFEMQEKVLGKTSKEASFLTHQNEMMNKAMEKGIVLTPAYQKRIDDWARSLSNAETELKYKTQVFNTDKDVKNQIRNFELQGTQIGKTSEEIIYMTNQNNLMNDAMENGIEITPEYKNRIDEWAKSLTNAQVTLDKTSESFNFAKDTSKSFFHDLKNGLIEGASLWKSFGNAVVNVLNKIFDKILDSGVDTLFSGLAGTGMFSSASAGKQVYGQSIGPVKPNAKGNAFDSSGIAKFAKGAAFTNRIVSSATPFMFANGGAFGEMGEAGPEAVMPLKRGPDGSLGVQSMGGSEKSSGGNVIVNVNNSSNTKATVQQKQTKQGVEIDVSIDQIVGEKLSQQGTESNRSLTAWNNRKMIAR